jgi:hypothetical protein
VRKFDNACEATETRFLTRCAGLVEIGEYKLENLHEAVRAFRHDESSDTQIRVPVSLKGNLSHALGKVNFIHRTVKEFLESHCQAFLEEPSWLSAGTLALTRGRVGSLSLIPMFISDQDDRKSFVKISEHIREVTDVLSQLVQPPDPAKFDQPFEDVVVEMVDHTYQVVDHVHKSLNGQGFEWREHYTLLEFWDSRMWFVRNSSSRPVRVPFHDRIGFAGYLGCFIHIRRHLSMHDSITKELNYLLACTIARVGAKPYIDPAQAELRFAFIGELLRRGSDPNSIFHSQTRVRGSYSSSISAWSAFVIEFLLQMPHGPFETALVSGIHW